MFDEITLMLSFFSPEAISQVQQVLGGLSGWLLFALVLAWIFVQLIGTILKLVRTERNEKLRRIASASEQVAALSLKDISPEIRKSLERSFLEVAGIESDSAHARSSAPSTDPSPEVASTIRNLKAAAICLTGSVAMYFNTAVARWASGWKLHFDRTGYQFEHAVGNSTYYGFDDFSLILPAACIAFVITRLFIPTRLVILAWPVAVVVGLLLF